MVLLNSCPAVCQNIIPLVCCISESDDAQALSGVRSVLRREANNTCAVDLLWELPENFAEEDVSHFTVAINDEEPNMMTQPSTSYTMCFCEPHNVTIAYIDRCGRTGSSTSVISLNTTQPLFECDLPATESTTTTTTTTTFATTSTCTCTSFDLNSKECEECMALILLREVTGVLKLIN